MTHTRSDTSARARRGRVLIVGGDADRAVALRDAAGRQAVHVPNVLDAIGELTQASSREPIEVVLLNSNVLRHNPENVVHALRQVDPAVRLVCVGREGVDRAVLAEFDAVTGESLDSVSIQRTLGASTANERVHEAAKQNGKTHDVPTISVSTSLNAQLEQVKDTPEPAPRTRASTPQVHVPPSTLGDTDLVEAVLHGPDGVQAAAIALIRQQTGWNDIALNDEPETSGSQHTGVPVSYQQEHFGVLTGSSVEAEQLRPWADWLARWLALDSTYRGYRHMAYHDELTDAYNRRYFDSFLSQSMRIAATRRRPVTVMVLDIDDFKVYNDTFGHAAGDEILRETVRLLTSVIRKGDRVCRIGGDEFAVIFADPEGPRELGSHHPESVEQIAKRFQDQICGMKFPKLGAEAPATLSVSAGLATYPWDGSSPDALLEHADQLALQSKRRGKNAITLGPGAKQMCRRQETPGEDGRG